MLSKMRSRLLLLTAAMALASALVLAFTESADAVSTQVFVLDDAASLAAGELDGTAVHSDGRVTIGLEARRLELEGVDVAWCIARGPNGVTYVGTGNGGKVYRLRGETLSVFAETGQLLVSALAVGDDGTVYAGTLPEGRIYAISPAGEMREFARPEGAEHVWALEFDPRRSRLFAGTGPEGKVFAIDVRGDAEVFFDSEAGHVMSLAIDGDGTLYAGTSDEAVVYRLRAPGRAEVVYDFPGNEVTALAVRDGALAVVANDMPAPRRASAVRTKTKATKAATTSTPRPGKGRIWRVRAGDAERVLRHDASHFTSVELAEDGTIYAGTGKDGRIVRVADDRTSATWIDVEERQVLDISLLDGDPLFVTGDTGALYRIAEGRPQTALWTSKVLDSRFTSRWGRLVWRGEGALEMMTRSGNTASPDDTWSDWSAPMTSPGPVRSPAARFVQLQGRFTRDPDATLRAVQLYYLPRNQRAAVSHVALSVGSTSAKKKAAAKAPRPAKASSRYKLGWKVDNTDRDRMRYRLRFRQESQPQWRTMLPEEEVLTATHYTWETNGIPDGWYVVQVEASDEVDNPAAIALSSTADSEPLLIDNHAPRIEGLAQRGGAIVGRAVDSLGPIRRLEYAVDGRTWRIFFPVDDLFDAADERFELPLEGFEPGSYIIAVRVTDSGGNTATSEITTQVGR